MPTVAEIYETMVQELGLDGDGVATPYPPSSLLLDKATLWIERTHPDVTIMIQRHGRTDAGLKRFLIRLRRAGEVGFETTMICERN